MHVRARPARHSDTAAIVAMLLADAQNRNAVEPALWRLAYGTRARLEKAVGGILKTDEAVRSEVWMVAEAGKRVVGVSRGWRMPSVPPIYTGALGIPGVLYDDCTLVADAPEGTDEVLIAATETALRERGAQMFIGSALPGSSWHRCLGRNGYTEITLYLGKAGFVHHSIPEGVRSATDLDVPSIVEASARHRASLMAISDFWTTHPEADARFDWWMRKSLTLPDRDMLVALDSGGLLAGYVIVQPIAPLLVPLAHPIETVGVLDDFYCSSFAEPDADGDQGSAAGLLQAAESAFARRNFQAALVVCPAGWPSKRRTLEAHGYRVAKVWGIRRG